MLSSLAFSAHFYCMRRWFLRITGSLSFARVLVLDKWTCNSDGRQCVFHRPPRARKYRVTFIDQGYCFNAGEWTFPDAPLRGVYVSNAAYPAVTGWRSFEPVLSRAEAMSLDEIQQCAAGIPEEWYEHDADALHHVIKTLYSRRSAIRELIMSLRKSSRAPFPNWKD